MMLIVVRSGTGHYHFQGRAERITRGRVGLVLPSDDPGLLLADELDPYDHFYCRFAGTEARRMARAISVAHDRQRFFAHPRWREATALLGTMTTLDRGNQADPDWMSPAEGELARLLSLLLVEPTTPGTNLTEASLRHYLLAHVAEPLDLDAIAAHFEVSRYHLSRKAHLLLGERLGAASRRLRIDLSCSLLEARSLELNIAEIARRVGYEDPLYFSKVFRRQVGASPRSFREAAWAKARAGQAT